MAEESKYGFIDAKEARKGVLNLKRAKGDDSYKIRVALGVINRANSTIKKTSDNSKKKNIENAILIWRKYVQKLKGEDEYSPQEFEDEKSLETSLNDAGSFDMDLGDRSIMTMRGQNRGLVIKLTEQGGYSIYYWKDDPAVRYPSEVYLDGKKVYMPIRMVHMGFEPDQVNQQDDVGRIQTENKKVEDDPDLKGHQPKKYYKGLSKDTKKKRDKHFKKQGEKPDDDPQSYKPAPGDKKAETKPSKYTKAFKKKFGEAVLKKLQGVVKEGIEKSLKNKSEKSGVPYSILKKVYDRGIAAWKTGHRPGTTPSQWGLARVNSFLTGGKTTKTADKDLYSKWKSKSKKEHVSEIINFHDKFNIS